MKRSFKAAGIASQVHSLLWGDNSSEDSKVDCNPAGCQFHAKHLKFFEVVWVFLLLLKASWLHRHVTKNAPNIIANSWHRICSTTFQDALKDRAVLFRQWCVSIRWQHLMQQKGSKNPSMFQCLYLLQHVWITQLEFEAEAAQHGLALYKLMTAGKKMGHRRRQL